MERQIFPGFCILMLTLRVFFFFLRLSHRTLVSYIFLVFPKDRVLGTKREGKCPWQRTKSRLPGVLVLRVTFKGEGKWIFLINQSVKLTVNIKVGMFVHILLTENSLCPSNTHTQIKGMLVICFFIKNTNSFRSHERFNHLLSQITCPLYLADSVFQLLYWKGSSWWR